MNLFKKIGRSLAAIAMAILFGLEKKERNIKLKKRLKRSEEKYKLVMNQSMLLFSGTKAML